MSIRRSATSYTDQRRDPNHSVSRCVAAIAGTIPVALAVGIALALALPLPFDQRFSVGWYSVFPVWALASCSVFLSRSATRAWSSLAVVITIAVVVVAVALGLGRGASIAGLGA